MGGAENNEAEPWTLGLRWADGQIDRATLRSTLTYRLNPRLTAGLEYNPLEGDVNPLVNWLAVGETERRPALMLGTSSDRIGTPDGQSYYATVSKSLKPWIGLPIAPYTGITYGTFDYKFRPLGGVNVRFSDQASALVIYDGVNVHPTVSWAEGRHVFSFLMVEGTHPGLSYSVSFATPWSGSKAD